MEAGEDLLPVGRYAIAKGEFDSERVGDTLLNLRDVHNVKRHPDVGRLNGCCGLDGLDGMNLVCVNGHEVATERSDCWLPHHTVLSSLHTTRHGAVPESDA
jgi:hypothetical protein